MNGGGRYTAFNKILPGVYDQVITLGKPSTPTTNGVVAGGIVTDWAPEGQVFRITAEEFNSNPVAYTGYEKDAPENKIYREIFAHANEFVGYALNENRAKATYSGVGEAKNAGTAGNNIKVSVLKNAVHDNKYDVSTYVNEVLRDSQTVGEVTEDSVSVVAGTETKGTSIPEELQKTSVTFDVKDNSITAKYKDLPEGYSVAYQLKMGNALAAAMADRIIVDTTSDSITISFTPKASLAATYTFIARVKDSKGYTTLSQETFTLKLNEGNVKGADAAELKENPYVVFKSSGVIEENAGYTFTGGTAGDKVTGASHQNALTALEPFSFNVLVCDSDDDAVKQLYIEFTKRLRDERGKYFGLILYNCPQADNYAVTSVYNAVNDSDVNASAAVNWVGGFYSSIDLSNELTNKTYDGELDIDVNIPQARLEILSQQGNFLFHRYAIDEIRTLIDVNTYLSYTTEEDEQLADNKVVRVVDYIRNTENALINDTDIGRLQNNPQGRAIIFNTVYSVLSDLQADGVIENFTQDDIEVLPCTDTTIKNYKKIIVLKQAVQVTGTIRQVYSTLYVIE